MSEFNFPRRESESLAPEILKEYIGDLVYMTPDVYELKGVHPWHLRPDGQLAVMVSSDINAANAVITMYDTLKWKTTGSMPDEAIKALELPISIRNFARDFTRSHNMLVWNPDATWCGVLDDDGKWVVEDVRMSTIHGDGIPESLENQRRLAHDLNYNMPEILFEGLLTEDMANLFLESPTPIVVRTINARQRDGKWLQWMLPEKAKQDTNLDPSESLYGGVEANDAAVAHHQRLSGRAPNESSGQAAEGVDEDASDSSGQPTPVLSGVL